MMRCGCLVAVLTTACSFNGAGGLSGDAAVNPGGDAAANDTGNVVIDGSPDAPPDARPDAPADAQSCFGEGLVTICLTTVPTVVRTVPGGGYNTSNDATCDQLVTPPAGPELCVVTGTSITVAGSVLVTGSRPLVLLALDTLTIPAGSGIDVSSRRGTRVGAGANFACPAGTNPEIDLNGAGGAAGGSFGGVGGIGGTGDFNGNGSGDGRALPGTAGATTVPTFVRGGCRGNQGAGTTLLTDGPLGGDSGGAVYLLAGSQITLAGVVLASGAAGAATDTQEGGAGGGTGGLIGFEAPMITVTGSVIANGAGGGRGGASDGNGAGGDAGEDGTFSSTNGADGATTGNNDGGSGGNGSFGASLIGTPGIVSNGGGGGGGGGAGYIYTRGTVSGGTYSPPRS